MPFGWGLNCFIAQFRNLRRMQTRKNPSLAKVTAKQKQLTPATSREIRMREHT